MSVDAALLKRGNAKCELCGSDDNLAAYDVPPITLKSLDKSVLVCATCLEQIENPEKMDSKHLRCLNDSMARGIGMAYRWRRVRSKFSI